MLIAWTTTDSEEQAEKLAMSAIKLSLAVCVQIDGPIKSFYRWDGKIQKGKEFRLVFKFLETQAIGLEAHIRANHTYDNPEWIVVRSEHVAEKYLSWAASVSTSSTL